MSLPNSWMPLSAHVTVVGLVPVSVHSAKSMLPGVPLAVAKNRRKWFGQMDRLGRR